MSGSEIPPEQWADATWYDLVDPATERVLGQVTRGGDVRSRDPDVTARVRAAFDRTLLAQDGQLAEELGVCFAGIDSVTPADAGHADLVFRNLYALTGLVPRHGRSAG